MRFEGFLSPIFTAGLRDFSLWRVAENHHLWPRSANFSEVTVSVCCIIRFVAENKRVAPFSVVPLWHGTCFSFWQRDSSICGFTQSGLVRRGGL